jgi:hypothetical protein
MNNIEFQALESNCEVVKHLVKDCCEKAFSHGV